jgi:hypothetical protein
MMNTDLFGAAPVVRVKGNGYAAQPGTGPAGKTCRQCRYFTHVHKASVYRKCLRMRAQWTGGPGTDIKASAPACLHFEERAA